MTTNPYESPKSPLLNPGAIPVRKAGIVQIFETQGAIYLKFGKPIILIGILGSITIALLALTIVAIISDPAQATPCITILLFPVTITLAVYLYFSNFNKYIKLSDNKISYIQPIGNREHIISEIDIDNIYSVSSAEQDAVSISLPVMLLAHKFPKYPEITIVGEPKNMIIKGPRRFSSSEIKLLLDVIDRYYRRIPNPA